VYKKDSTKEEPWRPTPTSVGQVATVGNVSGRVVAIRARAGTNLSFDVDIKTGDGATQTIIMDSLPLVLLPDGIPSMDDMKECPVQEKFLKAGGTFASITSYIAKLEKMSKGGIWFDSEGGRKSVEVWEAWLKRWSPGKRGQASARRRGTSETETEFREKVDILRTSRRVRVLHPPC
jgi:hypothetical protein